MTPTVKTFNTGFVEAIEQAYPIEVLETLLRDRTTGKNIVWADDEYEELGEGYLGADEITLEKITGTNSGVIKPRIAKEHERQSLRTKSRAEVFTPSWLCNQMNNHFDEEWFGRPDVFNIQEDHEWTPTKSVTSFPRRKGFSWKDYVCALRLEITCGEAPFICSRYDTVSGEPLPVKARVGFLDRKLRVVTEKSKSYEDWYEWALRALQSTYGYEYQGDNLIIARINVLETFFEHMVDRWDKGPTNEESAHVAEIISWNIWQMDGLTGTVPSDKPVDIEQAKVFELNEPPVEQMTLFEFDDPNPPGETAEFCQIFDWEENGPFTYVSLKSKGDAA